MKIRIKGSSLRYRLTKSEVERFKNDGYLEERACFGGSILTYAIEQSAGNALSARFELSKITLSMPFAMAAEWTGTDRVGFESTGGGVFLLVEKDFKCLDVVAEDQSDNYPNPLAGVR